MKIISKKEQFILFKISMCEEETQRKKKKLVTLVSWSGFSNPSDFNNENRSVNKHVYMHANQRHLLLHST